MDITEDQYKEYEQLLAWKKKEDIRLSLKETKNLEDDIDEPIKSCVMMLALLGTNPIYSCCGFDYEGQPYHKSHQYGDSYVLFADDPKIEFELPPMWEVKKRSEYFPEYMLVLKEGFKANPHWTDPSCIHFAENFVIAITLLEKVLWNQQESFCTEKVTLSDTNHQANQFSPYWQYTPKEPWTFDFVDLVVRMNGIWN